MPKMLMFTLAASGALAGAALVQALHWRDASVGFAQSSASRAREAAARMWRTVMPSRRTGPTTGNASFDAYRANAIRALEDEKREFEAFIERLRNAADMEAFEAFLASRRATSTDTKNT